MLEDSTHHEAIEAAIKAVESRTDAEVLVVVVPESGSYADLDHTLAILIAAVALVLFLVGTNESLAFIQEEWIPPLVLLTYGGAFVLSRALPRLKRAIASKARLARQVHDRARIAFVDEGATATRRRDGLLLYFSRFERAVEVVPDLGLEGKIESARWLALARDLKAAARDPDLETAVIRAIQKIGDSLEKAFPKTQNDQEEIPHRFRLRGA
jgi:putative membrane protein